MTLDEIIIYVYNKLKDIIEDGNTESKLRRLANDSEFAEAYFDFRDADEDDLESDEALECWDMLQNDKDYQDAIEIIDELV